MLDFTLSEHQQSLRQNTATFAQTHLKNARALYDPPKPHAEWRDRFRSTKPIYEEAVKAGMIRAQIPQQAGGDGGPLINAALVVEELYATETSASLTILGTGLGLTPLLLSGSPSHLSKFLPPFLTKTGATLASLVFSEPTGSANYATYGSDGLATTAVVDEDDYVISGEKIWGTNSGGWDDRGADLMCVAVRVKGSTGDERDVAGQVAVVVVTREDIEANEWGAFQVLAHPETLGHTAVNGPHLRFEKLRVPKANVIAPPGKGHEVIEQTFTASAALVGAMGVGVMRQAFSLALAWAKKEKRGGHEVMLEKQSVADLLVQMKMRLESARGLTWRAACGLGVLNGGAELCYEAKIVGSEGAVECVKDAISMVGMSAYSRESTLGHLLQDAMVLPIFDGGNVGVRRRQIEAMFGAEDYDLNNTAFE